MELCIFRWMLFYVRFFNVGTFNIQTLQKIVSAANHTYMGDIFRAIYLTSDFSFVWLFNLCPHSVNQFHPTKHLTIVKDKKMILILKWSKTLQLKDKLKLLHTPYLGNTLCPMLAVLTVLQTTPGSANNPFFQFKDGNVWIPLTDSKPELTSGKSQHNCLC